VEDNEQVRDLALAILKQEGYTVLVAEGGKEALEVLEHHDGPVDLLLTDVIMPEMNGKQLFERISNAYPDVRVLYMSGYTDNVIAHHGVMEAGIHFIQKPFSVRALVAKVQEALEST
jgi:two-component system cell cycle sensor histidine kinase/response regulator CckA